MGMGRSTPGRMMLPSLLACLLINKKPVLPKPTCTAFRCKRDGERVLAYTYTRDTVDVITVPVIPRAVKEPRGVFHASPISHHVSCGLPQRVATAGSNVDEVGVTW